jgi:hypothetical protein
VAFVKVQANYKFFGSAAAIISNSTGNNIFLNLSNPMWCTSGEISGMVLTTVLIFILVLLIIATIRMA